MEFFLRNRIIRSPVTKTPWLLFSFSYQGSATARDDCDLNEASSGILIMSPGLRSPLHDSSTRNEPSIVLPSVATTTCVAFQEQRSGSKEGLMPAETRERDPQRNRRMANPTYF